MKKSDLYYAISSILGLIAVFICYFKQYAWASFLFLWCAIFLLKALYKDIDDLEF